MYNLLTEMNNQIIIITILWVTILLPTIPTEFFTLAAPNAFGQSFMFDTNDNGAAPSSNMTETIPRITLVDIINSTYTAPADIDDDELDRFILRSVSDRIDDVLHTLVSGNATIVPTATITNDILDQINTTNNTSVFDNILRSHVTLAFERIRATSQPANSLLELRTDIETVCIANSTSLAECDINIRIR
jgi:hypothetical protein